MTQQDQAERWKRFCVVGLGHHARTKLLPAIMANRQSVYGLVTRQHPSAWPDHAVFSDIGAALAGMGRGDAVLIATPPALHFEACLAAAEAGIDIIVEKPAFLTEAEATKVLATAARSGATVVEAFMHRHTALHARFLALWTEERRRVRSVEAVFHIPAMPGGTFRHGSRAADSTLFDIGCYPLSLLQDMGLDAAALELQAVRFAGDPDREAVRMGGAMEGIDVVADVGVAESYANRVTLTLDDGTSLAFEPFFFGRPGPRRIHRSGLNGTHTETLEDADAFQTMLAVPTPTYRADQDALIRMPLAARHLDRLGESLIAFRQIASRLPSGGQL